MPSPTYGAYPANATDPYPIESTLAQIVGQNNPNTARDLLYTYQVANQTDRMNADYASQEQHEFARQALAQQLAETQLKEFHNIAKIPGGARFLAEGGIPGMGQALGSSPGALTNLATAADTAQAVENLSKGGQGFSSYAHGGFSFDPRQIPGMEGVSGTLGPTSDVQAANIRANAALAAARIRANADKDFTTVSQQGASPGGGVAGANYSRRVPTSRVDATTDEMQDMVRRQQDRRQGITPPSTGGTSLAPAQTEGGGSPNTSAKPTSTTNAPRAPQSTEQILDTNSPAGKQWQNAAMKAHQFVKDEAAKGNAAAQQMDADVNAGMKGGVHTIVKRPDGTIAIRGGRQYYILTAPQQ